MGIFDTREYEEDDYDKEYNEHEKKNEELLDIFGKDLGKLSEKTKNLHLSNASLFINDYFYRYEVKDVEEGAAYIDSFFDFFIHKCLWSSPYTVRQMAASIKKFYKSMFAHGRVEEEDLEYVLETIKYNLDDWVDESDIGDGDWF